MCINVGELLKKDNINAIVTGRPKHFLAFIKTVRGKNKFSQLFDLYGIRIIAASFTLLPILGIVPQNTNPLTAV